MHIFLGINDLILPKQTRFAESDEPKKLFVGQTLLREMPFKQGLPAI